MTNKSNFILPEAAVQSAISSMLAAAEESSLAVDRWETIFGLDYLGSALTILLFSSPTPTFALLEAAKHSFNRQITKLIH